METEKLRAALGWNADHYMKHLDRMQRAGKTWLRGWNSAAFFLSTAWFWYRRMYGLALLNLIAPVLLLALLIFVVQWFVPEDGVGVAAAVMGAGYLLAVFVLLPVFADSLYLRRLQRMDGAPRPPSAWTALGALLLVAIPSLLGYLTAGAQYEYSQRARIAEGVSIAGSLKTPVTEFYQQHKRLPGAQEAVQFRHTETMQHTASVGWDAGRRAIVATMGERFSGKRFEMAAAEKDGTLEWICRSIDLEPKLLPMSCR
jgi:type IV pilus assembly protein PilA